VAAVDAPEAVGALPRAGDAVDRYRVLGLVATGGMAAVFAAQRTSIGGFERLLALKVILPHLAGDRYFVDMFLDEARIVSQVHHANVVQVFDVVEHDGLPCIVMEFLHGRTLAALLETELDVGLRLLVLANVAKGLCAAHESLGRDGMPLGIIHRDVSPDNVHIGYDGHVKVVDFGIAAARGKLSSTRAGEVKGKLAFLAPEQLTASPDVSRKADVWSLGVMAWEVLARTRLFADDGDAATMWNVVHRPVPEIRERVPELDPAVAEAVMGCLRRDPKQRIEGEDVARALSVAASRLGATSARLAEHMAEHFSEDRRRVEAQLERTLSRAGHPVTQIGTVLLQSEVAPKRSRSWLAIPIGVLALAAGGIGWAAMAAPHEPEREPALRAVEEPSIAPTPVAAKPMPRDPAPTPAITPAIDPAPPPEVAPDEPTPRTKSPRRTKKRRKPRADTKPSALMDSPY
jgi:serine/threonine protein kinase